MGKSTTQREETVVNPEPAPLSDAKRRILERFVRGDLGKAAEAHPPITRRSPDEPVPLSLPQQQVWLHAQMATDVPFYNEAMTVHRSGPLDRDLVGRCLLEIIRRHEIWRTTFEIRHEVPVQVIHEPPSSIPLPLADLRNLQEIEREAEASQLATQDARLRFDLKKGPLFRARIVRLGDEEYRLYLTFHQIIFDAVSAYQVFLPELSTLYESFAVGKPSPLPEPAMQYGDFACWQRNKLDPEVWSEQLAFWKRQFPGELPVLEWPIDRPRPVMETHRGAIQRFTLTPDLVRSLRELAQREGTSLYMMLLAGLAVLLHRYTGQEDLVFGGPTAGRTRIELERVLGYFVNPVALRIDLSGNPTFQELLGRVRGVVLDALQHAEVPYPRVVEEVQPKPDPSRNPLFQVMVSQQPQMPPLPKGWSLETEEVSNGGSKMDLIIVIDDKGESISGPITYNPDVFDASTIGRMIGHWKTLLQAAAREPERKISDLPILREEEREQILFEWNDTHVDYPQDVCLHELIERQAEQTPEFTAVIFEEQELSYRELNTRANQLAFHLRKLGVLPDDLVGVCMERSVEMVVALLGVLKAGGAYVPLDPEYPKDRLRMMLEDSKPSVLLTQQHLIPRLPGISANLICLDTDWPGIAIGDGRNLSPVASPANLSYVIYTSGSTGKPKGVLNTHAGIVNRLLWMQDAYRLTPADRVLQKTPYSFDVSVWEFFWPLMTGACLVVAGPGGQKDADYLVDLICQEQITTLHFVPSMLQAFLEANGVEKCLSLRRVICSGEALPFHVQERFFSRSKAELHNLYGPTEAAVDVTYWPCHRGTDDPTVPIGRPIANVRIHILDRYLQPVPVGVPGELHIGGVGLARGYLNRPELSAERFISDPITKNPETRLYKTGDLAKYRSDGNIDYLGRIDDQVKVRGFRIELGEIESVLRDHPGVRDARVIVREDIPGDRRLTAYIVLKEEISIPDTEILDSARKTLPAHMIPELVRLAELPLT
ncbi:MAG: amino acid adenylation domain-containing protein, partial [Candidatus Acidiferrales bacterium]